MLHFINALSFKTMTPSQQLDALVGEVVIGLGNGDLRKTMESVLHVIDDFSYNAGFEFGESVTRDVMQAEFKAKMNDRKMKLSRKGIVKTPAKKTKTSKKSKRSR